MVTPKDWMAVSPDGTVNQWSAQAEAALGVPAEEALGSDFRQLVRRLCQADDGGLTSRSDALGRIERVYEVTAFEQATAGMELYDRRTRILRSNKAALRMRGLADAAQVVGRRADEVDDRLTISPIVAEAMNSRRPVIDRHVRSNSPPGTRRSDYAVTAFTLRDDSGVLIGASTVVHEVTEQTRVRESARLLGRAAHRIGMTLDAARTAQELAEVAMEGFADAVSVDLFTAVLVGENPPVPPIGADVPMRRVAFDAAGGLEAVYGVGERSHYVFPTPYTQVLADLRPRLVTPLNSLSGWLTRDPARAGSLARAGAHSLIAAPLTLHGRVLGLVCFYRDRHRTEPFDQADVALASELTARTSICVDNARRYTREHTTATTLQRSLLPRVAPRLSAVTAGHYYHPGRHDSHWFDVVPLSSARVGMVIGQVPGRGLQASATMGRFRTAVSTLAMLDLTPAELLANLEDVAARIAEEQAGDPAAPVPSAAVTCLYAVYDPVSGELAHASAGAPAPLLGLPDGSVVEVESAAGPPLGEGATYETSVRQVPAESLLALVSHSLAGHGVREGEERRTQVRQAIAASERDPDRMCEEIMYSALSREPPDGAAVLAARTHRLAADQVVTWTFPAEPEVVHAARAVVRERVAAWGLPEEEAFTTDLIVSELVTNAVRHTDGPLRLRLLRDRTLTIEVSDQATTAPHLLHARVQDESGRGLFIVASLTRRWGVRYAEDGKTVWAEEAPDLEDSA